MKNSYDTENQSKKVEELHFELQGWKSNLSFIEDEITFIGHLLNSYVFQPNTQNLFERLQDYLRRLKKTETRKKQLQKSIIEHENKLGGMMECTDEYCDLQYYRKHEAIKAEIVDFISNFRTLKSEIFNYAGGIMKKSKSTSTT